MADVVVLPWVPATATVRRSRQMAASSSARRHTRRPRRPASATSQFVAGMAVETLTTSASPSQRGS